MMTLDQALTRLDEANGQDTQIQDAAWADVLEIAMQYEGDDMIDRDTFMHHCENLIHYLRR